jgi:hypothetical protein
MTQADPAATTHSLTELPEGSKLRAVTAVPAEVAGRSALRVELTEVVTLEGKPGVDYVDMPTFVIIPASFTNGTIEVNILSRPTARDPPTPGPSPASPTASRPMATALRRSTCDPSTERRRIRLAHVTSVPFSTSPTPTGSSTGCASSTRRGTTKRGRTSVPTNGSHSSSTSTTPV